MMLMNNVVKALWVVALITTSTPCWSSRIEVKEDATVASPLSLINAERSAVGLTKLKYNKRLEKAATAHSKDMARFDFISHTGSNGSDLRKRLRRAGYKFCYGAENLALGTKSWSDTVNAWMTSPKHEANILDYRASSVGVAQVGEKYWVMVVGKKC